MCGESLVYASTSAPRRSGPITGSTAPLTYIKDEGVAESVVSVVTSVDQKLCV